MRLKLMFRFIRKVKRKVMYLRVITISKMEIKWRLKIRVLLVDFYSRITNVNIPDLHVTKILAAKGGNGYATGSQFIKICAINR